MNRLVWLTLLLLGLLSGCVSIQSHRSAGPYDIHHHTWWNYYQRGRLYLKEKKFAEAKQDFETAMGQIPGARYPYAEERWRARTYGLHMIEGYFPHRELGICLFELGRTDEALELLQTSLQMEPSARARFYINRIQGKQAVTAAPPPRLELTPHPQWTRQKGLIIKGTAHGSNAVAALTINGVAEFIELATPRIEFSRTIKLSEGLNSIQIVATDLSGKQSAVNLTITADWTPPQVSLHRTGNGPAATCYDSTDLHEVQINGQTLTPADNSLTVPIDPNGPLQLTATDRAGNRIEWSLSEKELQHLAQHRPPAPPTLKISGGGKTITLCVPEYALDLRAEDDTALQSIRLNGKELLVRNTPLFRSLYRVPLIDGTNQLVVAVEDTDGNRTQETTTVIYRPPEYMDRIYRLAASLEPLSGEIPNPLFQQKTSRRIQHELTLDPVRFYLLATENEKLTLREERNISDSNLADPRAVLKRGRQLDAELIMVPRVLSDGNGQTVYVQVLDTDDGKELFIDDVYLENPDQLQHQIAGLIMKIEQRFPMIQATLLEQRGTLLIDAGKTSGMQKGMRFLVIRSDGPFEQGRVIRAGNRPAELVVSDIESASAKVIIPRGQSKESALPGDYVFSR